MVGMFSTHQYNLLAWLQDSLFTVLVNILYNILVYVLIIEHPSQCMQLGQAFAGSRWSTRKAKLYIIKQIKISYVNILWRKSFQRVGDLLDLSGSFENCSNDSRTSMEDLFFFKFETPFWANKKRLRQTMRERERITTLHCCCMLDSSSNIRCIDSSSHTACFLLFFFIIWQSY